MPYLEGFDVFPEYDVKVGNACSTCQGLTSFNIVRMKSLGYYDKCVRTQILVGSFKNKSVIESLDLSQPIHLMGRCASGLKKNIEDAGGKAILTLCCPPVEPLLSWNIMDNKENKMGNIFNEKNIIKKLVISIRIIRARLRMRMESKPFIEWLKNQER